MQWCVCPSNVFVWFCVRVVRSHLPLICSSKTFNYYHTHVPSMPYISTSEFCACWPSADTAACPLDARLLVALSCGCLAFNAIHSVNVMLNVACALIKLKCKALMQLWVAQFLLCTLFIFQGFFSRKST